MTTETVPNQADASTAFLRAARAGQIDKIISLLEQGVDINVSNANGLNAIHLASKDGHVEVVKELLSRGAAIDAATKKGNTALHIASLAGQEPVVKLLVQSGAQVNVQSQNGFTPLYMAAQENHDGVVKFLLANGANQGLSTEDGFTPLAVAMQQGHDKVVTVLLEADTKGKVRLPALHIAAKKDDVKAATLLLDNEHNPDVTSKSGFTPLHIAAHYGNEGIAKLLLAKGADVNSPAKHNICPLHVAAKWGKEKMVLILCDNGASVETRTRDGLTPLHCAARSGHERVVESLLDRGAPLTSKSKNGLAPLHMAAQGDHAEAAKILLSKKAPVDDVTVDYLTALHVAAHCGHAKVAKLLLDRNADANARALNGFTPLHIACKKNRIKVVELLLKYGASIQATTESGLTPLHVAAFMGCMNIVIYLLQHDANPDVPTVRGETPLHLAARANQTDIIRILLRNGATVDAKARECQTPLHIASRLGNVDIAVLLLQHGADVRAATNDHYNALHIASKQNNHDVASALIEHGASLTATTKKGFTPLHLSAKYGNLKVAQLLLSSGASCDSQGKSGATALHLATLHQHQQVAQALLDKGADAKAVAKNGHTPLHIAARKNQIETAAALLEHGAVTDAASKAGFTPLHLAAQQGHTDMCSLLLEHGAVVDQQATNGLSALHLAAQEDRVAVANILIKHGADKDVSTKCGYTPLHVASHFGQTNMVKCLLDEGASHKAKTSHGYTALHHAAQQGHINIVNVLLEHKADANAVTTSGQTPLDIASKLGYVTVIETLKNVSEPSKAQITQDKYKVVAPEMMHETFMSDSEEEGGEDTAMIDQPYRYLTADDMKSLGDDSLPIDVTRDERSESALGQKSIMESSAGSATAFGFNAQEVVVKSVTRYSTTGAPEGYCYNVDPTQPNFLVSFLVDARGGAMRGCRGGGVRVIVPPLSAHQPTRITCRYLKPSRINHMPPLMEGEALAARVLEMGPVAAKFIGPVILEIPHFASLRGKERELVVLRSDNGTSWREHNVDAAERLQDMIQDMLEIEGAEDDTPGSQNPRMIRILTHDFPQYFAVISRIRQEVHAIGPEGGMVSSSVVPQVQAVFPQGALTKKIKVGLQAQIIDSELTAKLLGRGVAVSPVVTVEPRRRKFHKAITLSMPAPRPHTQGMTNQYSTSSAPTLRLLCSISGGTNRAHWEDVTENTPLTFVNDCVSFTTTVSARYWLIDCRHIEEATKMATELYREAIHVPFMARFIVYGRRSEIEQAQIRMFCVTDDKEEKALEKIEKFTQVAKSRDVEVHEGKQCYLEFAGNLVPVAKSGEQLSIPFKAFRENRLAFPVMIKSSHVEPIARCQFMREPKVPKGEPVPSPICVLNIMVPEDITEHHEVAEVQVLAEEDPDMQWKLRLNDPSLEEICNLLGQDWVALAYELGVSVATVNQIQVKKLTTVEQAQLMLKLWKTQSGTKAQDNSLELALCRIGRDDIRAPQSESTNELRIKRNIYQEKQASEEIVPYIKDDDNKLKEAFYEHDRSKDRTEHDQDEAKYSPEEKSVYDRSEIDRTPSPSEESEDESVNRSVAERKEKITKKLSIIKIPASKQKKEIREEIIEIKTQIKPDIKKFQDIEQKSKDGEAKLERTRSKSSPDDDIKPKPDEKKETQKSNDRTQFKKFDPSSPAKPTPKHLQRHTRNDSMRFPSGDFSNITVVSKTEITQIQAEDKISPKPEIQPEKDKIETDYESDKSPDLLNYEKDIAEATLKDKISSFESKMTHEVLIEKKRVVNENIEIDSIKSQSKDDDNAETENKVLKIKVKGLKDIGSVDDGLTGTLSASKKAKEESSNFVETKTKYETKKSDVIGTVKGIFSTTKHDISELVSSETKQIESESTKTLDKVDKIIESLENNELSDKQQLKRDSSEQLSKDQIQIEHKITKQEPSSFPKDVKVLTSTVEEISTEKTKEVIKLTKDDLNKMKDVTKKSKSVIGTVKEIFSSTKHDVSEQLPSATKEFEIQTSKVLEQTKLDSLGKSKMIDEPQSTKEFLEHSTKESTKEEDTVIKEKTSSEQSDVNILTKDFTTSIEETSSKTEKTLEEKNIFAKDHVKKSKDNIKKSKGVVSTVKDMFSTSKHVTSDLISSETKQVESVASKGIDQTIKMFESFEKSKTSDHPELSREGLEHYKIDQSQEEQKNLSILPKDVSVLTSTIEESAIDKTTQKSTKWIRDDLNKSKDITKKSKGVIGTVKEIFSSTKHGISEQTKESDQTDDQIITKDLNTPIDDTSSKTTTEKIFEENIIFAKDHPKKSKDVIKKPKGVVGTVKDMFSTSKHVTSDLISSETKQVESVASKGIDETVKVFESFEKSKISDESELTREGLKQHTIDESQKVATISKEETQESMKLTKDDLNKTKDVTKTSKGVVGTVKEIFSTTKHSITDQITSESKQIESETSKYLDQTNKMVESLEKRERTDQPGLTEEFSKHSTKESTQDEDTVCKEKSPSKQRVDDILSQDFTTSIEETSIKTKNTLEENIFTKDHAKKSKDVIKKSKGVVSTVKDMFSTSKHGTSDLISSETKQVEIGASKGIDQTIKMFESFEKSKISDESELTREDLERHKIEQSQEASTISKKDFPSLPKDVKVSESTVKETQKSIKLTKDDLNKTKDVTKTSKGVVGTVKEIFSTTKHGKTEQITSESKQVESETSKYLDQTNKMVESLEKHKITDKRRLTEEFLEQSSKESTQEDNESKEKIPSEQRVDDILSQDFTTSIEETSSKTEKTLEEKNIFAKDHVKKSKDVIKKSKGVVSTVKDMFSTSKHGTSDLISSETKQVESVASKSIDQTIKMFESELTREDLEQHIIDQSQKDFPSLPKDEKVLTSAAEEVATQKTTQDSIKLTKDDLHKTKDVTKKSKGVIGTVKGIFSTTKHGITEQITSTSKQVDSEPSKDSFEKSKKSVEPLSTKYELEQHTRDQSQDVDTITKKESNILTKDLTNVIKDTSSITTKPFDDSLRSEKDDINKTKDITKKPKSVIGTMKDMFSVSKHVTTEHIENATKQEKSGTSKYLHQTYDSLEKNKISDEPQLGGDVLAHHTKDLSQELNTRSEEKVLSKESVVHILTEDITSAIKETPTKAKEENINYAIDHETKTKEVIKKSKGVVGTVKNMFSTSKHVTTEMISSGAGQVESVASKEIDETIKMFESFEKHMLSDESQLTKDSDQTNKMLKSSKKSTISDEFQLIKEDILEPQTKNQSQVVETSSKIDVSSFQKDDNILKKDLTESDFNKTKDVMKTSQGMIDTVKDIVSTTKHVVTEQTDIETIASERLDATNQMFESFEKNKISDEPTSLKLTREVLEQHTKDQNQEVTYAQEFVEQQSSQNVECPDAIKTVKETIQKFDSGITQEISKFKSQIPKRTDSTMVQVSSEEDADSSKKSASSDKTSTEVEKKIETKRKGFNFFKRSSSSSSSSKSVDKKKDSKDDKPESSKKGKGIPVKIQKEDKKSVSKLDYVSKDTKSINCENGKKTETAKPEIQLELKTDDIPEIVELPKAITSDFLKQEKEYSSQIHAFVTLPKESADVLTKISPISAKARQFIETVPDDDSVQECFFSKRIYSDSLEESEHTDSRRQSEADSIKSDQSDPKIKVSSLEFDEKAEYEETLDSGSGFGDEKFEETVGFTSMKLDNLEGGVDTDMDGFMTEEPLFKKVTKRHSRSDSMSITKLSDLQVEKKDDITIGSDKLLADKDDASDKNISSESSREIEISVGTSDKISSEDAVTDKKTSSEDEPLKQNIYFKDEQVVDLVKIDITPKTDFKDTKGHVIFEQEQEKRTSLTSAGSGISSDVRLEEKRLSDAYSLTESRDYTFEESEDDIIAQVEREKGQAEYKFGEIKGKGFIAAKADLPKPRLTHGDSLDDVEAFPEDHVIDTVPKLPLIAEVIVQHKDVTSEFLLKEREQQAIRESSTVKQAQHELTKTTSKSDSVEDQSDSQPSQTKTKFDISKIRTDTLTKLICDSPTEKSKEKFKQLDYVSEIKDSTEEETQQRETKVTIRSPSLDKEIKMEPEKRSYDAKAPYKEERRHSCISPAISLERIAESDVETDEEMPKPIMKSLEIDSDTVPGIKKSDSAMKQMADNIEIIIKQASEDLDLSSDEAFIPIQAKSDKQDIEENVSVDSIIEEAVHTVEEMLEEQKIDKVFEKVKGRPSLMKSLSKDSGEIVIMPKKKHPRTFSVQSSPEEIEERIYSDSESDMDKAKVLEIIEPSTETDTKDIKKMKTDSLDDADELHPEKESDAKEDSDTTQTTSKLSDDKISDLEKISLESSVIDAAVKSSTSSITTIVSTMTKSVEDEPISGDYSRLSEQKEISKTSDIITEPLSDIEYSKKSLELSKDYSRSSIDSKDTSKDFATNELSKDSTIDLTRDFSKASIENVRELSRSIDDKTFSEENSLLDVSKTLASEVSEIIKESTSSKIFTSQVELPDSLFENKSVESTSHKLETEALATRESSVDNDDVPDMTELNRRCSNLLEEISQGTVIKIDDSQVSHERLIKGSKTPPPTPVDLTMKDKTKEQEEIGEKPTGPQQKGSDSWLLEASHSPMTSSAGESIIGGTDTHHSESHKAEQDLDDVTEIEKISDLSGKSYVERTVVTSDAEKLVDRTIEKSIDVIDQIKKEQLAVQMEDLQKTGSSEVFYSESKSSISTSSSTVKKIKSGTKLKFEAIDPQAIAASMISKVTSDDTYSTIINQKETEQKKVSGQEYFTQTQQVSSDDDSLIIKSETSHEVSGKEHEMKSKITFSKIGEETETLHEKIEKEHEAFAIRSESETRTVSKSTDDTDLVKIEREFVEQGLYSGRQTKSEEQMTAFKDETTKKTHKVKISERDLSNEQWGKEYFIESTDLERINENMENIFHKIGFVDSSTKIVEKDEVLSGIEISKEGHILSSSREHHKEESVVESKEHDDLSSEASTHGPSFRSESEEKKTSSSSTESPKTKSKSYRKENEVYAVDFIKEIKISTSPVKPLSRSDSQDTHSESSDLPHDEKLYDSPRKEMVLKSSIPIDMSEKVSENLLLERTSVQTIEQPKSIIGMASESKSSDGDTILELKTTAIVHDVMNKSFKSDLSPGTLEITDDVSTLSKDIMIKSGESLDTECMIKSLESHEGEILQKSMESTVSVENLHPSEFSTEADSAFLTGTEHKRDELKFFKEKSLEDICSSGYDTDLSSAEFQALKLESERVDLDSLISSQPFTDLSVLEKTIDEVKQSLEAAQGEIISEKSDGSSKYKQSPSEFQFKLLVSSERPGVITEEPQPSEYSLSHSLESKIKLEHESSLKTSSQDEDTSMSEHDKVTVQSQDIYFGSADIAELSLKSDSGPHSILETENEMILSDRDSSSKGSPEIKLRTHTKIKSKLEITDRRSASEVEGWSSSGGSRYESFEHSDSRPLSSDMDVMVTAQSGTEYETALTSQDISSQKTSKEFYTAASSLTSRDSMKSLDSEASSHVASIDISDASETLVPSATELKEELLESSTYVEQFLHEEAKVDSDEPLGKMKRSHEMRFRRSLTEESHGEYEVSQIPEKEEMHVSKIYDVEVKPFSVTKCEKSQREFVDVDSEIIPIGSAEYDIISKTAGPKSFKPSDIIQKQIITETSASPSKTEIEEVCQKKVICDIGSTAEIKKKQKDFDEDSLDIGSTAEIKKKHKDFDEDSLENEVIIKSRSESFVPKTDTELFGEPHPLMQQGSGSSFKSQEQASTSLSAPSQSSLSTDNGREYIIDDIYDIPEAPEISSKSELAITTEEKTPFYQKDQDSPTSDEFELVEKPSEIDDFVVIEEVAREAQENDPEGKSVQIKGQKTVRRPNYPEVEQLLSSKGSKKQESTSSASGSLSDEELLQYEIDQKKLQAQEMAEIEDGKKWIQMQFEGDPRYDYERVPLEDIKEEEMTDFDASRIGSLSSQKESIGSYGSFRNSYGSLSESEMASRIRFRVKGENDDISISSLQEFENLEKALMEQYQQHSSSSQDSLNGSLPKRYILSKSQGDDVSVSSLKEFEGLESACLEALKAEITAKQKEALLLADPKEITGSFLEREKRTYSGSSSDSPPQKGKSDNSGSPLQKMTALDSTMIRKIIDDKLEQKKLGTIGTQTGPKIIFVKKFDDRGAFFVPEIEDDDQPDSKKECTEECTKVSTFVCTTAPKDGSAESIPGDCEQMMEILDQEEKSKTKTVEIPTAKSSSEFEGGMSLTSEISSSMTSQQSELDSIVTVVEQSKRYSYERPDDLDIERSDSIARELSPSSGRSMTQSIGTGKPFTDPASGSWSVQDEDFSSSGSLTRARADLMLGSSDSLEATSSNATRATYNYEVDTPMTGSLTSGARATPGSNTMVSSMDTLDPVTAVHMESLEHLSSEFSQDYTGQEPDSDTVVEGDSRTPRAKERTIMFDSTDTLSAVSADSSVREGAIETPAATFYIGDTPIVRGERTDELEDPDQPHLSGSCPASLPPAAHQSPPIPAQRSCYCLSHPDENPLSSNRSLSMLSKSPSSSLEGTPKK